MPTDDEIRARFSLDTKEAVEKLLAIKGSIDRIGDSNNLTGLVSGLTKVGAVAGVVGVTFLVLKKAFETALDAERIKAINAQFEILGKQAGISTDKLRAGLEGASRGLIDDTDLINIANGAILTLGTSVEKLPALLDIARKSAALFGKDTKETFEDIVRAVETGNQRQLKRLGIIIDVQQAEQKYAATLGVTVSALNEHGKQQAVLNAVLEKGKKNTEGVNESLYQANNLWQETKVTVSNTAEALSLIFDKIFGKKVIAALQSIGFLAKSTKDLFGEQLPETVPRQIQGLIENLKQLEKQKEDKEVKILNDEDFASATLALGNINKKISETEFALKSLQQLQANQPKPEAESSVNKKQQAADEFKFQQQKLRMREELLRSSSDTADNEVAINAIMEEKKFLLTSDYAAKVEAISLEYVGRKRQRDELLLIAAADYELKKKELVQKSEAETDALKLKSLDNQLAGTDSFFGKVGIGLEKSSLKAKTEFYKFETVGVAAAGGLANGFSTAFSHIADGNFDLARDMKKAIFGALAGEAEAKGALLVASSIWPPNPLALAGGLGLLALGGTLRALAGGSDGGGRVSAPSSAGGGAGFSPIVPNSQFSPASDNRQVLNDAEAERTRKSVNITIQGNYFETEQTRQRLVEIIRDSADYSDFKVQSVGGGL